MIRNFKFQASSFRGGAIGGLLLVCLLFGGVRAESTATRFDAANKLFEQGQFTVAAGEYEKILAEGAVSASVWFNLGNARFRSGEMGRAIAAYRHASVLSPRDPDIRANLAFARAAVPGNSILKDSMLERALAVLRLNEWAAVTAAALWIWFGLLILRRLKPALKTALAMPSLCAGLALVISSLLLGAAFVQASGRSGVVVVADQTPVRFGPLAESQVAFTARDGAEYPVLERKDNWLMVLDPSRKSGWLESGRVALAPGY